MGTFSDKFYNFCCSTVRVMCLLLAIFLFISSFLSTSYSIDMQSQTVLFRMDNPLWGIFGLVGFGVLFFVMIRVKKLCSAKLMVLLFIWCCVIGGILILFGKTVPAADAMSVYSAAGELAEGRTTVIAPDNSYFSYYPQQMGLVGFYELLIRFWNILSIPVHAYHFIKFFNVLMLCVILFFQKETVHLIWEKDGIDRVYLLMAGLNLPFIMYTSFIYGEIPSYAFVTAGLYFLLRFLQADSPLDQLRMGLFTIGLLSVGVALRKNNLIFIIAVLIVVFLKFFKERGHYQLLFTLLCALCAFNILPVIQKTYELRAGSYLRSGVPPISYLAMGMQDMPDARCVGWYNGFNFNTYRDTGMNTEATVAVSLEAINERISYFKDNPGYTAQFYLKKHLSQWADGTYASRQATLATFGGRSRFLYSIYEGDCSRVFLEYSNHYQNLLYLGVLLFCVFQCRLSILSRKKSKRTAYADQNDDLKTGLPLWVGMIGIIGGFLFHIVWEANSRYILLYSLTMMPYSAWGIHELLQWRSSNKIISCCK